MIIKKKKRKEIHPHIESAVPVQLRVHENLLNIKLGEKLNLFAKCKE